VVKESQKEKKYATTTAVMQDDSESRKGDQIEQPNGKGCRLAKSTQNGKRNPKMRASSGTKS
jgi:hypothetical protein